MAALQSGKKCSHTACMLRFLTALRLALNPDLIFEIGFRSYLKNIQRINMLAARGEGLRIIKLCFKSLATNGLF
jgi:hypothetical protein